MRPGLGAVTRTSLRTSPMTWAPDSSSACSISRSRFPSALLCGSTRASVT
jgi:hypothetical protein